MVLVKTGDRDGVLVEFFQIEIPGPRQPGEQPLLFLGAHDPLEVAIVEGVVAHETDVLDLQLFPFGNVEFDIDLIVGQLGHAVVDLDVVEILFFVQILDNLDVRAHTGQIEHRTGFESQVLADVFIVELLVSGNTDTQDGRFFLHVKDQPASFVQILNRHPHIHKETHLVNGLKILVNPFGQIGFAHLRADVASNGIGFDPVVALNENLNDLGQIKEPDGQILGKLTDFSRQRGQAFSLDTQRLDGRWLKGFEQAHVETELLADQREAAPDDVVGRIVDAGGPDGIDVLENGCHRRFDQDGPFGQKIAADNLGNFLFEVGQILLGIDFERQHQHTHALLGAAGPGGRHQQSEQREPVEASNHVKSYANSTNRPSAMVTRRSIRSANAGLCVTTTRVMPNSRLSAISN